ELLRGKRRACPPETRDDFVEDQENAVFVADLADPLQIALRRNQHAGRAGDRLDDHGGDGGCVVQGGQSFELLRKLRTMSGLAARVRVPREVMRVSEVIYTRQQRGGPHLPVADDAPD